MAKIFISHSAKDQPVSDHLSDLLIQGCNLSNEDVFSGSIENAGIMIGSDFMAWIKDRLKASDIIIQLVTPNYIESKLCMAEMGAAWALDREIFPFLHPDIDRELSFIFLGNHTARLNEIGLDNLKDYISDHIKKTDPQNDTWPYNKKEFLDKFPGILKSLPAPEEYTAEEYNKIHEEKEAVTNLYQNEQKKNSELQSVIEDLKRAKKAEETKVARLMESARHKTDEKSEVTVPDEVEDNKTEISKDTEIEASPNHEAQDKTEADMPEVVEDNKEDKVSETDTEETPDQDSGDEPVMEVSEESKENKPEKVNDTEIKPPSDDDTKEEPVNEVAEEEKDIKETKAKEIEKKDPPDLVIYDKLVKEVTEELSYFGKAVKRCLFAYFSNEDWVASSNSLKWYNADIQKAERRDYIEKGITKDSYTINEIHTTITPVIDKLKKLDQFLLEVISPDLSKYLENKKFLTPGIQSREYWESELLSEELID